MNGEPVKAALLVATVMLLIAFAPLPYGSYTLLRLVCVIVFGWACYAAFERGMVPLAAALGIAVLLFNPIIPVHSDKETWAVLDGFS